MGIKKSIIPTLVLSNFTWPSLDALDDESAEGKDDIELERRQPQSDSERSPIRVQSHEAQDR